MKTKQQRFSPLTAIYLLIVLVFGFCAQRTRAKDAQGSSDYTSVIDYNLKSPVHSWPLPQQLNEISGIAKLGSDSMLAIEDLHADLYFLQLGDQKALVRATLPFAATGKDKFDIEDVSIIGDTIYALWSHGSIFKIWNWKSKVQSKELPTFLDKKNNTEGLAFDPVSGNLLVACKKESDDTDEKKSTRAIYEFDVRKGILKKEPFLIVNRKDFKKFIADKVEFFPSGIAVHPLTHDIYIISTRGNKCIACYDHSGQLKSFEYFNENLLPQPEGICFDKDGNLYISTEAKHGKPAFIYEFAKAKGK